MNIYDDNGRCLYCKNRGAHEPRCLGLRLRWIEAKENSVCGYCEKKGHTYFECFDLPIGRFVDRI